MLARRILNDDPYLTANLVVTQTLFIKIVMNDDYI